MDSLNAAIDAILKDYSLLLEVLKETHAITSDEYWMKVPAWYKYWRNLLPSSTILYFITAEQVSLALQKKNIAIQDALSVV